MPIVHTGLPKHTGELELAKILKGLDYSDLNLWFSLDYIPGVRDIDMYLIEPNIGAFVIEIKAISLEMIESIRYNRWQIKGRNPDHGPIYQAYAGFEGLRNYFNSKVSRVPYTVASACFPKISREKWNEALSETEFCGEFSNRLIFREDIESGAETFRDRLLYIFKKPPIRAGLEKKDSQTGYVTEEQIRKIVRALDPDARPKPTPTDLERLRIIERGVTDNVIKKYPPEIQHFVHFTGYPGTGKTFRLLQIIFSHVYVQKNALYICYNKTLSADISRLLKFSDKLAIVTHYPTVMDIFELAAHDFEVAGLAYSKADYDIWLDLVVSELKSHKERLRQYDVIVVDEAQELNKAEADLMQLHLAPGGSLFFALGQGQEIFNKEKFTASSAMKVFTELDSGIKPEKSNFRRNFRNTRKVYLIAHAFYEGVV